MMEAEGGGIGGARIFQELAHKHPSACKYSLCASTVLANRSTTCDQYDLPLYFILKTPLVTQQPLRSLITTWDWSYRVPPLRIDDLIDDLKDGTKMLALLEVLSGGEAESLRNLALASLSDHSTKTSLPVERGRNLKRPHFLSNANTALQFLQSKKIKLVNINSSDLVDGRPPVVLGLIWTIIL
uniref:Calponin-homology (CH) domain-containing protein n=1 Tax=Timema monikensis TaxID=170555 RepID=A0A7R9E8Y1_9NEOP|nr:unnamed protein product [Timema monikensis]